MTKIRMGQNVPHAFGACSQTMITIGLAGLLAWHSALSNYLFAPSAGMAISPLFAAFFSASLLVAYCYASYRADSTLLSHARLAAWFIACIIAGSVAACLIAARLLPTWSIYVAAVVVGFSWASCAFLWAGIAANSSLSDTFRNLACALVLASAADLFFMHGGDVRSVIAAPFFGAVSLAGFLASLGDSIMSNDQILVRPQNTRTYMRIAAAATLFAGALGVTAGSTAHAATEIEMATINENVSTVALVARHHRTGGMAYFAKPRDIHWSAARFRARYCRHHASQHRSPRPCPNLARRHTLLMATSLHNYVRPARQRLKTRRDKPRAHIPRRMVHLKRRLCIRDSHWTIALPPIRDRQPEHVRGCGRRRHDNRHWRHAHVRRQCGKHHSRRVPLPRTRTKQKQRWGKYGRRKGR